MRKLLDLFQDAIEKNNTAIFEMTLYVLLAVVATVMTVMNVITDKGVLTYATGVFALLNILNIVLVKRVKNGQIIASLFFSLQLLTLFTFFLISGNPDGFSAIWIIILPLGALFLYGRKKGSLLCACMFAIMVFLLWTSAGNALLKYDYGDVFRMRFPVLYIADYLVALFLETVKDGAIDRMTIAQNKYKFLSNHDNLTQVYNRQGLYDLEDDIHSWTGNIGVAMFDIDHFKDINDIYGHVVGDQVLKGLAGFIQHYADVTNSILCRWGGEEFVVFYKCSTVSRDNIEAIHRSIASQRFIRQNQNQQITVSVGVFETAASDNLSLDFCIAKADEALYSAKDSGRNRVIFSE